MSRTYPKPIRVLVVVSFAFSLTEVKPHKWSPRLGAYPGVTVGGNLELTASGAEVILCDYPLKPDSPFVDVFIHIRQVTAEKLQSGCCQCQDPGHQIKETLLPRRESPCSIVSGPAGQRFPRGNSSTELTVRRIHLRSGSQGFWVRQNLMMTAPRVWSTLKTTDDGTFGKCRNPGSNDERG